MYFKLDQEKNVIACEQEEWNKQKTILIAQDEIDGLIVSTVFIGKVCDCKGVNCGEPILFETLVLNKDCENIFDLSAKTWDESLEKHQLAIDWVKNGASYGM